MTMDGTQTYGTLYLDRETGTGAYYCIIRGVANCNVLCKGSDHENRGEKETGEYLHERRGNGKAYDGAGDIFISGGYPQVPGRSWDSGEGEEWPVGEGKGISGRCLIMCSRI